MGPFVFKKCAFPGLLISFPNEVSKEAVPSYSGRSVHEGGDATEGAEASEDP